MMAAINSFLCVRCIFAISSKRLFIFLNPFFIRFQIGQNAHQGGQSVHQQGPIRVMRLYLPLAHSSVMNVKKIISAYEPHAEFNRAYKRRRGFIVSLVAIADTSRSDSHWLNHSQLT